MSSKNKTQVIIAGKIYTLSGYESEEYLQRVAAYLNGKISEFKNVEGYSRLSPEMRGIMLNLNTADDYFKMKKKIEELEQELTARDKELYDFKHELITAQIKLENAEKDVRTLEEKNVQLQKENIQLEAQLKNQNKR
ncbi:MAG TPA: cell division protein ZapA [Candidatus Choladousia intestinipullorum]|nr:cell division protein ZapA [Candidatus Choladousia intestinipullorum]